MRGEARRLRSFELPPLPFRHPFAPPPGPNKDPDRQEITRLRREAVAKWIRENRIHWTVDMVLARAEEVGQERAAAEAVEHRNANPPKPPGDDEKKPRGPRPDKPARRGAPGSVGRPE